jgi:hypothetical protein
MSGRTKIAIVGDAFHINGQPTYAGRSWNGLRIEGLLLNSRMVQGIFDDLNPDTRSRWAYADTGRWDPERNTTEFCAAMAEWRAHGLLAFTLNLQGGSPEGYSAEQPWHNSTFESDGRPRPDYLARLERVLETADTLGLVVILGLFYFGQAHRLKDEAAVIRAVEETVGWILDRGYTNVLIEIANECDIPTYTHPILMPPREHELVERTQRITRNGQRLLASTSYRGRSLPSEAVVRCADFLLLHGNGESNPHRIRHLVRMARAVPGYTPKPILFNEDDHFDFERSDCNFLAAVGEYASWGYFDPYADGFQSPPVNWGLHTERKRAFFEKVREMTGSFTR